MDGWTCRARENLAINISSYVLWKAGSGRGKGAGLRCSAAADGPKRGQAKTA